jgi:hypothetical protein
MTRIAHCCCGSLRAEATGQPRFVACHCRRHSGDDCGPSIGFFSYGRVYGTTIKSRVAGFCDKAENEIPALGDSK